MIPLQQAFLKRLKEQFPQEHEQICDAFDQNANLSIRNNTAKRIPDSVKNRVPWSRYGQYLTQRPEYSLDPLFHAGTYYPQEASSMIIEQCYNEIAAIKPPDRILDLCAAPGGKSTHLLQLIPDKSVLLSNEIVPKRYSILYENLVKWGYPNFISTNYRPDQLTRIGDIFDLILVDAPCSGEGLFRKQKSWREKWTVENCNLCARRQTKILDSALKLLRPGGHLIYSTCTLNPHENLDQINFLLSKEEVELVEFSSLQSFGFKRINKQDAIGYLALPHRIKGEPFFVACIRKKGNSNPLLGRTSRILYQSRPGSPEEFSMEHWTDQKDDQLFSLNNLQLELAEHLEISNIKCAIPELGTYKKDIFIPAHFSAMCKTIKSYRSTISVNKEQALRYLRHESLSLDVQAKGWWLIQYEGVGLGWIKYDGRRIINKYPMKWRLRLTK